MRQASLAMAVLCILVLSAPAASQDGHDAHGHGTLAAQAVPEGGWPTDAPLRAGMREVASLVAGIAPGQPVPDAAVLAGRVNAQVATIVAECALPPDADAALHPILGALAGGASALGRQPDDAAAVERMRHALADYARLFDDPGFDPP